MAPKKKKGKKKAKKAAKSGEDGEEEKKDEFGDQFIKLPKYGWMILEVSNTCSWQIYSINLITSHAFS